MIVDRWIAAIREIVRDTVAARMRYQGIFDYVCISSGTGNVDAVPADNTAGLPNLKNVPLWTGVPGLSVQLAPQTHVGVLFLDGNPAKPRGVLFDSTQAVSASLDVATTLALGPQAASVALAGGALSLVPTPWATALDVALAALATALATGTLGSMASGGTALGTALGALPPNATTRTKGT
jgi:hypothetical protein